MSNTERFDNERVIILTAPHKINYWCAKLGVTETDLTEIILKRGNNANTVSAFIHARKKPL